jgi:hypothetical protein
MIAVGVGPATTVAKLSTNFPRPVSISAGGGLFSLVALGRAMVKETKFFRKQAVKAERMALSVSDAEISQRFLNMAKAYRSQADVLKAKKLKAKKLKAKKVKAKKPKVKKRKAKKKSGKKRRSPTAAIGTE